ncbi:DUF2922 domain-containing protein [Salinicoccus halitifaciens]|uniref:DUF2922 domain-containing protein n=1 Tax=Salinicoccus halitifaciens TaxID=1073415 RepID=A0ABV2E715_9STAP|nr:DUF2922 domain-containing protein [Salinicoccus halitifaciens]MCD2136728.1 DUF2922 domain-containing protein [Salinicoccus halitifaciens]
MEKRLVVVFNTDANRRFTMNFRNPDESLTEAGLLEAANNLIASDALDPMQGKPVNVESAKIVSTETQVII